MPAATRWKSDNVEVGDAADDDNDDVVVEAAVDMGGGEKVVPVDTAVPLAMLVGNGSEIPVPLAMLVGKGSEIPVPVER